MKDNNLRVLFYLCGDSNKASSRVRGFWIAEALEEQGDHCTLRWNDRKIELLRFALLIPGHDIIIFQKTYSRYHRWLMKLAKMMGKRCYIDIDDAPSKNNAARTIRNFESMLAMADGVFAGSEHLYDYCHEHQAHTHLMPSSIYLKHYPVVQKHHSERCICIGWIGNGAHYKKDLIELLVQPLTELACRNHIRFKIVGACGVTELYEVFGAIPGLDIDFIDAIAWSDPGAIAASIIDFDIGVYPLLGNAFNHFKCGFKALEYMAMGTPVVSSAVAVNVDLIHDGGNGYLVDSEQEWIEALERLICDGRLRSRLGLAGRAMVEEQYNVEKTAASMHSIMLADCLKSERLL